MTPGEVVQRTEMFELLQYKPTTKRSTAPLLVIPDDQQVLRHRPCAWAQPALSTCFLRGIRSLSSRGATPPQSTVTGASTLRRGNHRRDGNNSQDHQEQEAQPVRDVLRWNRHVDDAGAFKAQGELDQVSGLGWPLLSSIKTMRACDRCAQREHRQSRNPQYRLPVVTLDGRHLAEAFAWLRPNDLIWSYWVNNYLLGRTPPKFDVLFWNADTTRMTAALHKDFVEMGVHNSLGHPGKAEILGTRVDLRTVDTDVYAVAGIADHICPWSAAYGTTQLFGGDVKFVLSSSGHIAAIINPPGNPKAKFRVADKNPKTAEAWLKSATAEEGSWWPDFSAWAAKRGGGKVAAPTKLGDATFPPLGPAPGTYISEAWGFAGPQFMPVDSRRTLMDAPRPESSSVT